MNLGKSYKIVILGALLVTLGAGCDYRNLFQTSPTNTLSTREMYQKCFENIGLKETSTIAFDVDGEKVIGTFTVDNNVDLKTIYPFTATINGGKIENVLFKENTVPELLGKQKQIMWELIKPSDQQMLKVMVYGQDYEAKSFSWYPVEFEQCANK